jgi:LmbE family N-acetylglucosaminyl deacetylase
MRLQWAQSNAEPLSVLCIGAHSDDIEIGCGGTLLRLRDEYPHIRFDWMVMTATGIRRDEACKGLTLFTGNQPRTVRFHDFQDGFLPYAGGEVKAVFEDLKREINPHIVFTHSSADAHQDHRLLCELTWNTFRNHTICEYEVPKYDGDLGRPNFFVPLDTNHYQRKVSFLMEAFESQRQKAWFDPQTFLGLMRLRGMESNAPSGYAEAFYCRKLVI